MSALAAAGATLLAQAQAAVHLSPDRARDLLVEAIELLRPAGDDARFGQACELMGWIAIETGDLALAAEPLAAARAAYQALGHDRAVARVETMLAFLAAPEPFASDADLLQAEAALAATLFRSAGRILLDPAAQRQALIRRTRLDLQRRVPMHNGAWPSLREVERLLALDRLATALLAAAAAREQDRDVALALRAARGRDGAPEPALLFACVAPALVRVAITAPMAASAEAALAPLHARALLRPTDTVQVEPDILAYLGGVREPAAILADRARGVDAASFMTSGNASGMAPGSASDVAPASPLHDPDLPPLPPEVRAHVRRGRGLLALTGAGRDIEAVLALLARDLDVRLLHVRLDDIRDGDTLARVIAAAIRDARLEGASALLDWADGPDAAFAARVRPILEESPWTVYMASRRPEAVAQLLGPDDIALYCSEEPTMTRRDRGRAASPGSKSAREADRLLTRARDLVLRGALDQALPLYEQGGRLLRDEGMHAEAVVVLVAAARLHAMLSDLDAADAVLDDIEDLARHASKLGEVARARAEIADQRGDLDARGQAWQAAFDHGDRAQRFFALLRLADVARAQEDPEAVSALFDRALAFAPEDDPAQVAEVHIERAVVLCLLARHDDAGQALQAAEALCGEESILRARVAGQRGVIALAQGNTEGALEHGAAARALAVAATHIPTYLSASMLIYMAHRQAGDVLRAYDTLVRARASLQDLQGPEGAALVQPALDTFAAELGAEEFDAVHRRWADWRRSQKQP